MGTAAPTGSPTAAPTGSPTTAAPTRKPTTGVVDAQYICRNNPATVRDCANVCSSDGRAAVGTGKFTECTKTDLPCTKKKGPVGKCSVCDCGVTPPTCID